MNEITYDGAKRMTVEMDAGQLAAFLDSLHIFDNVRVHTIDDLDMIPVYSGAWWYGNGKLKTYSFYIAKRAQKATVS